MGQAYTYNENTDDPIMLDGSSAFTGVVSAVKANRIDSTELADLRNGDIGPYGTAGARCPARLVGDNLSNDYYVDENGNPYETLSGYRYAGPDYVGDTQKIWFFRGTEPKLFLFAQGKVYVTPTLAIEHWKKPALEGIKQNELVCAAQLSKRAYFVDNDKLRKYYYDESDSTWKFGEVGYFKVYDEESESYIDDEQNPIPRATVIETHTERLVLAGISDADIEPDTIFFSDYLDGDTWIKTESIRVGGDGDPIIGLKSWRENTLLVFKAGSVWAVACSPLVDDSGNRVSPAYWTVNKISDSYGIVARESITQVGNDVWFLSKSGVVSVQRALAAEANEMQNLPISIPIQDIIDRISWSFADSASAVYFKDHYYLSLPIDNSTRPNVTLVFNTVLQKWQGIWEGTAMRQSGYARTNFDGIESLVWRTHDGTVYEFLDDDLNMGADVCEGVLEYYEQKLTSRAYTFEGPLNQKRAMDIEVEFWESSGRADIAVSLDGKKPISIAQNLMISSALKLPTKLPTSLAQQPRHNFRYNLRMLPRFRDLQVIVRTSRGRAKVRNIAVKALVMAKS